MKRKKTLLVLCGILVVAIIAIFAERAFKQHMDKINSIDEEVFAISQDDVTALNITHGEDEIELKHSDDTWTYTEDSDFPVDQDYVSKLVSKFESVHASFIIDDVEDYSQYGIDNPEATVVFTTADGEKKVTFGTFSKIDEKRYICVDDGSVYLIDDDILEDVSAALNDFLLKDKVNDYSQLTAMVVKGDGNVKVTYDPDGDYTYTDAYDYYAVSGDNHQALSETKVLNYVSKLKELDLSNYETYKATEEDLAKYGLDHPTLAIALKGEVPSEDEDDSAVESKSQKIYLSKEEDADTAYLNFVGSTIVYTISADDYDALTDASYEALRPDEIVSIDWTEVASISVKLDDQSYVINCDTDKKDGNTYILDDEKVDFLTSTSKINGLTLSEVGDDYKKGQQELAVAITLQDEDATVVNMVFYQYDGDSVVVAVDGKVVGLCSRSSMSSLREEMTSAILNKGKDQEE